MLDTGVRSATVLAISNGQVRVLDSCVHDVAQHFYTTEMLNTSVQINLAGHKEKGLSEITTQQSSRNLW